MLSNDNLTCKCAPGAIEVNGKCVTCRGKVDIETANLNSMRNNNSWYIREFVFSFLFVSYTHMRQPNNKTILETVPLSDLKFILCGVNIKSNWLVYWITLVEILSSWRWK